jgi:uncharacterized membrane protein YhiD involved in acid resistance
MVHLMVAISIVVGLLGVAMTIFSLCVVRINSRLEKVIDLKETALKQKTAELEERNKTVREQEGLLFALRQQVGIKDRTIRRMERNGKYIS